MTWRYRSARTDGSFRTRLPKRIIHRGKERGNANVAIGYSLGRRGRNSGLRFVLRSVLLEIPNPRFKSQARFQSSKRKRPERLKPRITRRIPIEKSFRRGKAERLDRVSPYQCVLENFTGRATLCGAGLDSRAINPMTAAFRSASYFGLLVFGDESEQPVFFVGDSSREKDSARLRAEDPTSHQIGAACHRGA